MFLSVALMSLPAAVMLLPAAAWSAPADWGISAPAIVRVLASDVTPGEASGLTLAAVDSSGTTTLAGDSSGLTPPTGDSSGLTPMMGDSTGLTPMMGDSTGMIPTMVDTLAPVVPAGSGGTDSSGSGPTRERRSEGPPSDDQGSEEPPSEAWTTIKSGLVPGWGQLVNKEPLKAGLFFGAWAFFAGQAIVAEQDRKDAQEAFDASGEASDMEAVNEAVDRRNSRLWWMGGVAIFSMLDAYVDVHFWKFEEQWSARLGPTPEGGAALALRLRLD